MNNIPKYIVELLYFNDCVIIPNFGGLIANYQSSEIDFRKNIFTPPSKELIFNKNLQTNDGLLISFIQNKEKLNYKDASNKVYEFVNSINIQLKNKKSYTIRDLGTFYSDVNKNVIFNTETYTNLCIESYGFESFHFPQLVKEETVKHIKERFKDKEAVKQTIKHPFTKKVLIGLPLIIILLFLPFKSNIIENNYEEANLLHKFETSYDINLDNPNNINNVIENIANKENALLYIEPIKNKENIHIDTIIIDNIEDNKIELSEENSVIEEKQIKDIKIEYSQKPKDKYFIIAGSFAEKSRANKFCNEIKAKGFNPIILERQNGRLRVSVDSFSKHIEAKTALEKYKKESELSLWLLTM